MKALLLLSGGFDSPVSGWMIKERGAEILAVHFSSELVTDINSKGKAEKLAQLLGFKLFAIDISRQLIKLSRECDHRLYFVLMKRLMCRIAEKVAQREGCSFLITGDNLGQVSSQTLDNMGVIDESIQIKIIRPLLGFDKDEIIRKAKEIGTYEISKGKEHCDALGPPHPKTRAKGKDVLAAEEVVRMDKLVGEALD